jgi:hypothetical protein
MSSEVEICNIALGWLGGDLIISLDDPSVEAKLCKANYTPLRDAVQEEREWTFAVIRVEPIALVAAPVYGFDKAFQIPAATLRVLQVSRAGDGVGGTARGDTGLGREDAVDWIREGDRMMVNGADRIFARVLTRITDTTKFSPAFVQALAARIAMDLAIPLTNSEKVQQSMAALYGEKIALAASSDGLQGRSSRTRSNAFTVVR